MELRQVPGRRLIPGDAQLAGRLAVQNRAALAAVIDSQRSGTRAQRRSRLPRRAGERRVFVCMRASKHESRESVLKNGPSQPNRTRKEEIHAWWVTPGCPCIALLRPSAKGAGRLLDAGRLQASGRAGRTGPFHSSLESGPGWRVLGDSKSEPRQGPENRESTRWTGSLQSSSPTECAVEFERCCTRR